MWYSFSKYSACGNDFILVDNRSLAFSIHDPAVISRLCHRQNGIGADGIILLENSQNAHYKMRIFNSDGSEAEMCGNGMRCLLKFIQECGIQGNHFTIETMLKILTASFENEGIAIEMGDPKEIRWSLPIFSWEVHHLDTGVPHAVIFCSKIHDLSLIEHGSKIRFHSLFEPRGANVNFVEVHSEGIYVRTYERGVERETLACGTGATAAALAAAKIYAIKPPIKVSVRSGESLLVDFKLEGDCFSNVRLIGPAQHIFRGELQIW